MELLKAQEPLGRAEREVTQQTKVQMRKIEKKCPLEHFWRMREETKEFMTKLLVKI